MPSYDSVQRDIEVLRQEFLDTEAALAACVSQSSNGCGPPLQVERFIGLPHDLIAPPALSGCAVIQDRVVKASDDVDLQRKTGLLFRGEDVKRLILRRCVVSFTSQITKTVASLWGAQYLVLEDCVFNVEGANGGRAARIVIQEDTTTIRLTRVHAPGCVLVRAVEGSPHETYDLHQPNGTRTITTSSS